MSQPTKLVEIDFANGPGAALSSATWTDVTSYVRSIRATRGKQREQDDHFAPGQATVVLDNSDGRFDPNNTSSPYSPNVLPMRRIRILASDPSVIYDDTSVTYDDSEVGYDGYRSVFVGYIREWPQQWRGPNDGHVTLNAVDAFAILTNRSLPESVWVYEIEQDAPDHWWRLSEESGTTAVDSGFGSRTVDGTYSGSPTLAVASLIEHNSDNTAVTFDGADDLLAAGQEAAVGAAFTIELVIDNQGAVVDEPVALFVQGDLENPHLAVYLQGNSGWSNPGAVEVQFNASTSQTASGTVRVDDQGLHHVLVTYDGTTATIYTDGTANGTATASPPPSGPIRWAAPFSTQTVLNQSGNEKALVSAAATLDELGTYSSALSSTRATAHATAVDEPWNADTSGARVGRMLDLAGWPSADRDVDTGQATFGDGSFADDSDVLAYLNRCADSENGHLFITKDGKVRFVQRYALITESRFNTSRVTFADANSTGAGEYYYQDLELDAFGVDDVVNAWTVQRKFGVSQTAEDATSQSNYLTRSKTKTALLMDTDAEALAAAQYYLARTKDPNTKISKMVFVPGADDNIWEWILGLELMDRVTVQRDPPGSGTVLNKEVHIIGIQHEIGPQSWVTTMWLSPTDTVDYLILDDAVYGKLDSNALAY